MSIQYFYILQHQIISALMNHLLDACKFTMPFHTYIACYTEQTYPSLLLTTILSVFLFLFLGLSSLLSVGCTESIWDICPIFSVDTFSTSTGELSSNSCSTDLGIALSFSHVTLHSSLPNHKTCQARNSFANNYA